MSDKNSDLKPVGSSQQSALISVSVPLDEIFIHLHATTDRPRFDLPTEQLKHLEELRKRKDLTLEQREAEIQALRVVWYSQMGSGLLEACIDTRQTTKETWQQLIGEDMAQPWNSPGTVGRLAWQQLSLQWNMDSDARDVVIQKLDDDNAIICAASALMLQQGKHFTEDEQKMAGQKIMRILRDEDLSRRPLDPPGGFSKVWRLDDVLFETLEVLGE